MPDLAPRTTRSDEDEPGNGQALEPFRWWQLLRRSVLSLRLADGERRVTYSVEVHHGGEPDTGRVVVRLYRDQRVIAWSPPPARFPVPGGWIEVQLSDMGMRRCHCITHDGRERALEPDPRSAEGRRLRLARRHPRASRVLGAVSVVALVVGLGLNLLQGAEYVSSIPSVDETIGGFTSPLTLPAWLNITLGCAAVAGATERALRMRYHWLLDGGAAT